MSIPMMIKLHRKMEERKIGKTIWLNANFVTEIVVVDGTTRIILDQIYENEYGYEDVIETPNMVVERIQECANSLITNVHAGSPLKAIQAQ